MRAGVIKVIVIRSVTLCLLVFGLCSPQKSRAVAMRPLLLTTSYGVIAGTLSGVASLAFYDTPSDHYRNVAIGSSLGLYGGILLWGYMAYVVPQIKNEPSLAPPPAEEGPKGNPDDPLNLEGDTSQIEMPSFQPYAAPTLQGGALVGFEWRF